MTRLARFPAHADARHHAFARARRRRVVLRHPRGLPGRHRRRDSPRVPRPRRALPPGQESDRRRDVSTHRRGVRNSGRRRSTRGVRRARTMRRETRARRSIRECFETRSTCFDRHSATTTGSSGRRCFHPRAAVVWGVCSVRSGEIHSLATSVVSSVVGGRCLTETRSRSTASTIFSAAAAAAARARRGRVRRRRRRRSTRMAFDERER